MPSLLFPQVLSSPLLAFCPPLLSLAFSHLTLGTRAAAAPLDPAASDPLRSDRPRSARPLPSCPRPPLPIAFDSLGISPCLYGHAALDLGVLVPGLALVCLACRIPAGGEVFDLDLIRSRRVQ